MNNIPRPVRAVPVPVPGPPRGEIIDVPPRRPSSRRAWAWGGVAVALALAALLVLRQANPGWLPVPGGAAPWWAGSWECENAEAPALALRRAGGDGVMGEGTFFLTPGFLVRRPVHFVADGQELLFRCGQGEGGLFLLAPDGPDAAKLYRLRRHELAGQMAARDGQGVLIPHRPEAAHELVARLKRAGGGSVRLGAGPARPAEGKPAGAPKEKADE